MRAASSPPPPTVLPVGPRRATDRGDEARRWLSRSAEGEHYAFGLWPIALAPDLRRALDEGRRKAGDFIHAHGAIPVDFEAERIGALSINPFLNINEPGDLARVWALLQQGAG